MVKIYQLIIALILVSLTIVSCDKANEQTVSNDLIIKLEAISNLANLAADGTTIIQFKAKVPPGKASEQRDIVFTLSDASLGKFTGTSANNKQTVRANTNGEATSSVKLGVLPGDYFISAEIVVSGSTYRSVDIPITLKAIGANDKIQLTTNNSTPVADGNTQINLTVISNFSQDKKVTLTAIIGAFVNSTDPKTINVILDDQGRADIPYRVANEVVPVNISAKLSDGSQVMRTISPTISYPDTVLVEPSGLRIDTLGGNIQLSSVMRKFNNTFKVSKGQQVFFTAYQNINGNKVVVGRFTGINNATSDIEGNVPSVKFFADTGNINHLLPILIEISALKSPNEKMIVLLGVTVVG